MSLKYLALLALVLGIGCICAALVTFILVLQSLTKVNEQQDTVDMYHDVHQEHEQQSVEMGKKSFRKLNAKYGCDSAPECYW